MEINTKFILKPIKYEDTKVDMAEEMHLYLLKQNFVVIEANRRGNRN